ncbi:predicted protein [Histoplasma capsulatum H143]|uniref:Uncharacterized protein n=1 Tax=Ajellomyces capsulatus (strain H143) TaxID=544712 RepID=C6HMJ3_AJECH|nr:predicted protein [Histoplasma capsulatum H143]
MLHMLLIRSNPADADPRRSLNPSLAPLSLSLSPLSPRCTTSSSPLPGMVLSYPALACVINPTPAEVTERLSNITSLMPEPSHIAPRDATSPMLGVARRKPYQSQRRQIGAVAGSPGREIRTRVIITDNYSEG